MWRKGSKGISLKSPCNGDDRIGLGNYRLVERMFVWHIVTSRQQPTRTTLSQRKLRKKQWLDRRVKGIKRASSQRESSPETHIR